MLKSILLYTLIATLSNITTPTPVRIMQYNVEWLFIDYNNASDCPGNGCTWKNQSEAQIHLDTISNNVQELSPDIVHFCEVQGIDELQQVANNLESNTYNPLFIQGKDTSTGQNVGLLSKIQPTKNINRTENRYNYPILGSKCGYTGVNGSSGVSKHLISEFTLLTYDTVLIGAHLLAFPTDPTRCAEREAQAMVLQEIIIDALNKKKEVIVMGDFNDYDSEVLDSNSDIPKSIVLDILKMNGKLHSVAEWISQQDRYSEWYDENGNCKSTSNEFSMIDHILVSPLLFSRIKQAFIYHGYTEECGTYQSDHYPVIVDFA